MSAFPSSLRPSPVLRSTPQKVSFQLLPSMSSDLPVASRSRPSSSFCVNFARTSYSMMPAFTSSQSGRSWTLLPRFLESLGRRSVNSRRSSSVRHFWAWKAASLLP